MNYLAHLHLGGAQPAQLLGSLYGDFVKGPLGGRFAPEVEAAIGLHRRIDAFTERHPPVRLAGARFPAERGGHAGIPLPLVFVCPPPGTTTPTTRCSASARGCTASWPPRPSCPGGWR